MRWKSWLRPLAALLLALILTACGGDAIRLVVPDTPYPAAVSAPAEREDDTPAPTPVPGSAAAPETAPPPADSAPAVLSLDAVPPYRGEPYIPINGNVPYFTPEELTDASFERYSELDGLGRCGVVYACVGQDLMPTGERGSIGMVRPTGWHTVRYDELVDGKYLYNRCHLIGFQLTGENANTANLITGTRYLNMEGMLPFEDMVAGYVKETGNHVMYRVTPVFDGDDLLASGVLMEGWSVEDGGAGVCFCVYAYNVQPGVDIDYATGESVRAAAPPSSPAPSPTPEPTPTPQPAQGPADGEGSYILNTNTMKFHAPSCPSVEDIQEENREEFHGAREELMARDYAPCGRCEP